jgi:uridine kinase
LPTVEAMEPREEAVLITGVYGAGKSSVAEEIADVLEKQGAPYAVVDLDWLGWFGPEDEVTHQRVLAQNLAAVVNNYRAAGVRLFVLAYAVPDAAQLEPSRR